MKAITINKYGGTEVIETSNDSQKPAIKAGQILVEVHAASLNRIDSVIRAGYLHQMMPLNFPSVLGGDFAGIVAEVGEGVTNVKTGDEVYGYAGAFLGGSGSLAEYTSASVDKVSKKPISIDMATAASLPLAGASAIQAIEEHIKLRKGQKILIHGGSGGIGSLAIQLAKFHEAYVATTVSTSNIELAKQLGADEVIDYKTNDFTSIIKDYDAVLVAAAEELGNSYKVLKKGGTLVSIVGNADENLAKEHGITAITQMTQTSTSQLKRLGELVDSGKIKPLIDKTFTLNNAKEAFDYFEQKHPRGKVVIKIK
jgi:NADPH:quinone reductase and related Zn-dependent oxidoreductases